MSSRNERRDKLGRWTGEAAAGIAAGALGNSRVRAALRDKMDRLAALHDENFAPEEHSTFFRRVAAKAAASALKKNKKPNSRQKQVAADAFHRWGQNKLHSGRPHGPIVHHPSDQKQAVAIALSEAGLSHIKKYNQDHGPDGRFAGPGTSHQPTGNPVGRPPEAAPGAQGALTRGQRAGLAGSEATGAVVGGWLGAAGMGALGDAVGGPIGGWVGGKVGQMLGDWAGGTIGSYTGQRIASSLMGLKEQQDQHPLGGGATIGAEAAGWGAYLASRALPEGNALRPLLDFNNHTLAGKATQAVPDLIGGAAGGAVDTGSPAAGAARGARVQKALFPQQMPPHGAPPGKKPPGVPGPKLDTTSFASMSDTAMPRLFGPNAWKAIKNTPFGAYIRAKVKDVADTLDDGAAALGIDLTPATPQQLKLAQASQQTAQANQQALDFQYGQAARQPPGTEQAQGGAAQMQKSYLPTQKRKLAKLLALPLRAPNDAAVFDSANTYGTPANVAFLRAMQTSEDKSRQLQLTRALAQPSVANLQPNPNEDEQMYRNRMQRVMAASVGMSDRLRPQLFNGGASQAGLSGGFPDQQRTLYQVRAKRKPVPGKPVKGVVKGGWTVESEITKAFDTKDSLKRGLVYGWASIISKAGQRITDHQGDRIKAKQLQKAAHDYISNSRQGGVLHDEFGHEIGHIVESVVLTKELQKHLGIDLDKEGWLIGYKIEDPRVKMLVKSGMLKSFSIGGKGRRVPAKD